MLISLCQSLVDISRRTNLIIENETIASPITIVPTATPDINCSVNFIFSAIKTGQITITGTLSGTPQSEVINISLNTVAGGVKLFSSITEFLFDSSMLIGAGTFTAKYIGADGGSISSSKSIVSGYPLRVNRGSENLLVPQSGSNPVEKATALLPFTEVFEPTEGDIITLQQTSVKFLVTGNPFIEQVGFNSYWMLNLQRYQNL